MDERQIARFLAYGRIVIGTALVIAPGRAGDRWFGPSAYDPTVKVAIRALGVRDAALGIGAAQALADGTPVGPWVRAGMLSDVVDCVSTVIALKAIGPRRAIPAAIIAGSAAVIGARIATNID